jgi:prepilin peptidase CpaA
MTSTPAILMLAAGAVALIALVTDVRARRIPNWLSASALLLGFTANLLLGSLSDGATGALSGVLSALAGAALGFCVLFPFYVIRVNGLGHAIGAGDVKLLAALGAIVGPHALVSVAVYGALVGALQATVILANQGRLSLILHQTLVMRTAPTLGGRKAPYAVALAAGVFLTMVLPPILRP